MQKHKLAKDVRYKLTENDLEKVTGGKVKELAIFVGGMAIGFVGTLAA